MAIHQSYLCNFFVFYAEIEGVLPSSEKELSLTKTIALVVWFIV